VSYITELAEAIRVELPAKLVPSDDDELLFLLYAVLLLSKGTAVTREDVHHAWSAWMTYRREAHESLVPFDQLAASTKAEDEPFVRAIRHVAINRGIARDDPNEQPAEST